MSILAFILIIFVAIQHYCILILEMFFNESGAVQKNFGLELEFLKDERVKKIDVKSRTIQWFSCFRINVEFNRNWRISISDCNFLPDLYCLCSYLWFCNSFKKNIFTAGNTCFTSDYVAIATIIILVKKYFK